MLAREAQPAANGGEIPTMPASLRLTGASKRSLKSRAVTDVDEERRRRRWDVRVTSRKHVLKNIKLSRLLVGTLSRTAISTAPALRRPLFPVFSKGP